MKSYDELGGGLEHLYLEDSYVLGLFADGDTFGFVVDAVQADGSPYLTTPKPGEQHCHRTVRLMFPETTAITWAECRFRPSFDAEGAIDFDNIDSFHELDPGIYRVTGAWGDVVIASGPPTVDFLDRPGEVS